MARWKPKDPQKYPARYSDIVLHALESGDWVELASFVDHYPAKMKADHFREWRFNLRNYQVGRAWPIERDYRIRVTIMSERQNFIVMVKVERRRIDALLTLNPSLGEL